MLTDAQLAAIEEELSRGHADTDRAPIRAGEARALVAEVKRLRGERWRPFEPGDPVGWVEQHQYGGQREGYFIVDLKNGYAGVTYIDRNPSVGTTSGTMAPIRSLIRRDMKPGEVKPLEVRRAAARFRGEENAREYAWTGWLETKRGLQERVRELEAREPKLHTKYPREDGLYVRTERDGVTAAIRLVTEDGEQLEIDLGVMAEENGVPVPFKYRPLNERGMTWFGPIPEPPEIQAS